MSDFSVNLKGHERIAKKLKLDIKKELETAVFDIAATVERERQKNIKTRIYAKPASPNYKRTGRALGGSINRALGGSGLKREVISDTRLKGAEENYAPMLNRNKKFKRFHTRFWDDAVKKGEKMEGDITKKIWEKLKK